MQFTIPMFETVNTLQQEAVKNIKSLIINGELKLGERVNEVELSNLLHMSRGPIRESLRILNQEGLVTYVPRKGMFVTELEKEDIQEIYDLRFYLEKNAVELGFHEVTTNIMEELDKIVKELEIASKENMAALVHPHYKGLDPDMGFFNIAKEAGGNFLYYLLIIVNIMAAGIANALAAQSAISRILFSMSRDKLLPGSGFLGKVHPKFQTPFNATLFVGVVSLIVAEFLSIETIIKFVNFGALTSFMLLNITVMVYFYFKKKQRGLGGFIQNLLFPLIGFAIIAYVWSGFDKVTFYVGFGWLAVGIIVGAIKSKGYKVVPASIGEI